MKKLFLVSTVVLSIIAVRTNAQGTWVQKANFGGTPRADAVGFSIGNKGYMGTGQDNTVGEVNDFWEWDPITNVWTQKTNFGGLPRTRAARFSIGNKGYICTGGYSYYSDLWEYDPIANSWTQKANFPGQPRVNSISFSIGNKGYVGTGTWCGTSSNWYPCQDFWEWDQVSNTWSPKSNVGNAGRNWAVGFSIGTKGYMGVGNDQNGAYLSDFWEWDQATNAWTQKANFAGIPRIEGAGFSIGTKGYIGTGVNYNIGGLLDDFWEWDQATNVWTQKANFGGVPRAGIECAAFSIGCKGYFGTGYDSTNFGGLGDFWEYTPDNFTNITATITTNTTTICKGQSITLTSGGGNNYLWNTGSTNNPLIISPSITTTYSVIVSDTCGSDTASVTITVNQPPVPLISGNTSICIGDSTNLTASGGILYSWNIGVTTSSIIISPTSTTTYSVIVTNTNGCTGTNSSTIIVDPCTTPIDCPDIFIPNAFSPNGDNENDILLAHETNCVKDFLLVIYNRWGEKVFQTTNITNGWDGTYQSTKENSGVFVYYFEATLVSGLVIRKKGNVTLVQ